MISKFKKYILIVAMSICLLSFSNNTYATETTNSTSSASATLNIKINYSDNIKATKGDTFYLELKVGSNVVKMNIDASEFATKDGNVQLPIGNYEIKSFKYNGKNQQIIKEGYGATRTFSLQQNDESDLNISIGTKANDTLVSTYASVFMCSPLYDKDGYKKEDNNENMPYTRPIESDGDNGTYSETSGSVETSSVQSNEESTQAENQENQKPSVEHYTDNSKKDKTSSNLLIKGLPLVIISLIVIIGAAIYFKKTKI